MMKFLSGSYFWIPRVFRKYLSLPGTRSQTSMCTFSIKSADCNKTVFLTQIYVDKKNIPKFNIAQLVGDKDNILTLRSISVIMYTRYVFSELDA